MTEVGTVMSGDLVEATAQLWPGAEVVSSASAPDGRPVRARYAVIRRSGTPSMLVPTGPPRAAAESIRRISAASTLRDQATRTAAGAAIRRVPSLLREQVEVRGGHDGLAAHLGELLGTEVSFSVSIGSARVNRKPVLQVFDPAGRSVAFAKVGWSPHTNGDVIAEGNALAGLSERGFEHLVPPAVLARSSWLDHPVLVVEPLRPRTWAPPSRRWSPPAAAMEELARHGDPERLAPREQTLGASLWWRRQWFHVGQLADPVIRARLGRAMDQLETQFGDRSLRWGSWHGDWTPWNMALGRAGVLVWDWERFETGVPVGMDPLHYVVNAMYPAGAPSSALLLQALAIATDGEPRWEGPAHLRKLLYLVAVLVRYLRLVDVPGGEHVAPRAARTLLALEELMRS